ncbi:hypothetical protein J6590_057473 [Homalodisca vitripennis]|nr:hypothetical protein J6590_057473 [Homalodisca vitripennis]
MCISVCTISLKTNDILHFILEMTDIHFYSPQGVLYKHVLKSSCRDNLGYMDNPECKSKESIVPISYLSLSPITPTLTPPLPLHSPHLSPSPPLTPPSLFSFPPLTTSPPSTLTL